MLTSKIIVYGQRGVYLTTLLLTDKKPIIRLRRLIVFSSCFRTEVAKGIVVNLETSTDVWSAEQGISYLNDRI